MILDLSLARACLADQSWPPMVDLAVGLRVTEQNGAEEAGAVALEAVVRFRTCSCTINISGSCFGSSLPAATGTDTMIWARR